MLCYLKIEFYCSCISQLKINKYLFLIMGNTKSSEKPPQRCVERKYHIIANYRVFDEKLEPVAKYANLDIDSVPTIFEEYRNNDTSVLKKYDDCKVKLKKTTGYTKLFDSEIHFLTPVPGSYICYDDNVFSTDEPVHSYHIVDDLLYIFYFNGIINVMMRNNDNTVKQIYELNIGEIISLRDCDITRSFRLESLHDRASKEWKKAGNYFMVTSHSCRLITFVNIDFKNKQKYDVVCSPINKSVNQIIPVYSVTNSETDVPRMALLICYLEEKNTKVTNSVELFRLDDRSSKVIASDIIAETKIHYIRSSNIFVIGRIWRISVYKIINGLETKLEKDYSIYPDYVESFSHIPDKNMLVVSACENEKNFDIYMLDLRLEKFSNIPKRTCRQLGSCKDIKLTVTEDRQYTKMITKNIVDLLDTILPNILCNIVMKFVM